MAWRVVLGSMTGMHGYPATRDASLDQVLDTGIASGPSAWMCMRVTGSRKARPDRAAPGISGPLSQQVAFLPRHGTIRLRTWMTCNADSRSSPSMPDSPGRCHPARQGFTGGDHRPTRHEIHRPSRIHGHRHARRFRFVPDRALPGLPRRLNSGSRWIPGKPVQDCGLSFHVEQTREAPPDRVGFGWSRQPACNHAMTQWRTAQGILNEHREKETVQSTAEEGMKRYTARPAPDFGQTAWRLAMPVRSLRLNR